MCKCFMYLWGDKVYICNDDNGLTTSVNKEYGTVFNNISECQDLLKGTALEHGCVFKENYDEQQ